MIGVILCVNSWISKHCSQYRSAFQHQGSFSVLEQHLFFCSVQFSRLIVSDFLQPPLNRSTPDLPVHPQSLPKLMTIGSLIRCRPLLLLSSIFPNIRVFSNESALQKLEFQLQHQSFDEHPERISFRMDWLDFLATQGTLKSLLQHHSSKASILLCSAFFIVHLYIRLL